MPSPYLTKSDFKACYDCRTKLYYRKKEYPTNHDANEYLQFLADGGFMIETVAKAQYPHGVDLVEERDPQRSFSRTRELIAASPMLLSSRPRSFGKNSTRESTSSAARAAPCT